MVLETFTILIKASNKVILKNILYIYSFIQLEKDEKRALINLNNEIKIKTPVYRAKLYLKNFYINIKAWKIDNFIFKIFEIILTSC